jgi:3-oxoadipate enol-lactonase
MMQEIRVDGVRLAVVDRGRGQPLLLVHGFPLNHTMWENQIQALSASCRVIAPDLRGFGHSTASAGAVSMRRFADDLAALLDALHVEQPIVLCGLSMGGYISFAFWQAYAARLCGLILCDTRAAADSPEAAAGRQAMAERVLRDGPGFVANAMLPRLCCAATHERRPEVAAAIRRMILAAPPQGVAAAALGMAQRLDMTALLPAIACPALVIVGRDDAISPAAEMRTIAQAMPRATFVEIADSGHMSPMEQPQAVNRAIADFLAGLPAQ